MTAQIAILSKNCIALATDSAVTVQRENGRKTYNTVNKLFMMSKYEPVGIMIYGNAVFMGVPWEVIIKSYRQQLGTKRFDHLEQYGEDFFSFIERSEPMFPQSQQRKYFAGIFRNFLIRLKKEIDDHVEETLKEKNSLDESEIACIVRARIRENCITSRNNKLLPQFNRQYRKDLIHGNGKDIESSITNVLQKLPISRWNHARLRVLASHLVIRDSFHPSYSGIVISGYGEKNHFPRMRCFHVEGVFGGKVKRKTVNSIDIGDEKGATLIPFAQSDMVAEFMEGVHPTFVQFVKGYLGKLFEAFPQQVTNAITGIANEERKKLEESLNSLCHKLLHDMDKERKRFQHFTHVKPVIETIDVLPKEEMATMAEALINLTQFRQKITLQLETVGGPIDVAVISKGDGFIWIRRKHYFRSELNQHFSQNYFREENYANTTSNRNADNDPQHE